MHDLITKPSPVHGPSTTLLVYIVFKLSVDQRSKDFKDCNQDALAKNFARPLDRWFV